jgi:hypothetical protein
MEFASKAFQFSQQAHEKSENFAGGAKNAAKAKPAVKGKK